MEIDLLREEFFGAFLGEGLIVTGGFETDCRYAQFKLTLYKSNIFNWL
jgi:hypothetical protein